MIAHKSSSGAPALVVDVDFEQRILRMRFGGVVRGQDMKVPLTGLREVLTRLGRGFVQLTDLTEVERMELDSVPQLTQMMDALLAAGVARIIRVIPDPTKDIGFTLLSLTHYRGKVPITTFKSRAEAEQELAGDR